jgi:polypeptide N-acetylgalactosaminyltransferase
MKARMLGGINSKGPALIFMDAHMEVSPGWLEPLLDRLAVNRNITALSVIHGLNSKTLGFALVPDGKNISLTGFDWKLMFTWISLSEKQKAELKSNEEPIASPTMLGAFFGNFDMENFEKLLNLTWIFSN